MEKYERKGLNKAVADATIKFYKELEKLSRPHDIVFADACLQVIEGIEQDDKRKFDLYADYVKTELQNNRTLKRKIMKNAVGLRKKYKKKIKEEQKARKEKQKKGKKRFGFLRRGDKNEAKQTGNNAE